MTTATLLKYLIGSRTAISEVSQTRQALYLGALLVLSAALAREYDGKDLLAEPWHLAVPFLASLITSLLLFGLVWVLAPDEQMKLQRFWPQYRIFLTFYWLTAPLAWLYALPVEHWFSAGDAMRANLWLLAIVATWRVALMVRVLSVMFTARPLAMFWPVMLFGDTVALFILFLTPLPVFNIMGGIRLSDREAVILTTVFVFRVIGVLAWPLWAIGTMAISARGALRKCAFSADQMSSERISRPLWAVGALSIVAWLPVLPMTQPEQRLRHAVERDFATGRIVEAVQLMSAHQPEDFPPHWEPPPHIAYWEKDQLPVLDVVEATLAPGVPDWVQDVYVEKLENQMREWDWWDHYRRDLLRVLAILKKIPRGREIATAHVSRLYEDKQPWSRSSDDADVKSAADAQAILDWVGYEPPETGR